MRCDELRKRIEEGQPVDGESKAHITGCGRCREEFSFLRALRSSMPEPPAGLRARVLEAMPLRQPAVRWQVPAAAAAMAMALGLGVLIGRSVEARSVTPVEVQKVVVVQKVSPDERDAFVLGVALESIYGGQVSCDYQGMSVKKIHAKKSVMEMVPYCPVAQKLEIMSRERPELVEIQ